jgi:hypothetical protein
MKKIFTAETLSTQRRRRVFKDLSPLCALRASAV